MLVLGEHPTQPHEIVPPLALLERAAEKVRGMVHDNDRETVFPVPIDATPELSDRLRRREERLGRHSARRDQQTRRYRLDLASEIARALRDLVGVRIAVAGRPALDDVRDVDIATRQTDGGQHGIEQLAGAADERLSAGVLFGAGRLPDELNPQG